VRVAVERSVGLSGRAAIVDVGGGSTELTTFEASRRTSSVSLPLGTVRMLSSASLEGGPISRRRVERLGDSVDAGLAGVARHLASSDRLIVTGGTARAFVNLCSRDGAPLTVDRMVSMLDELRRCTESERMKRYDLRPDRADTVIAAGIIVFRMATAAAGARIEAPNVGLRHGVLAELAADRRRMTRVRSAPTIAASA
jgi:exopolyphosphatase/guanosine-5'-triphosphate,3'-diphosphate pyrophosphatase